MYRHSLHYAEGEHKAKLAAKPNTGRKEQFTPADLGVLQQKLAAMILNELEIFYKPQRLPLQRRSLPSPHLMQELVKAVEHRDSPTRTTARRSTTTSRGRRGVFEMFCLLREGRSAHVHQACRGGLAAPRSARRARQDDCNFIAGGGFFAKFLTLPVNLAREALGERKWRMLFRRQLFLRSFA